MLIDSKRKVAETLDEYRGQWKYNLMDEHCRALNAVCPTFFQWDDHEVTNNWSSSKDLSKDDRYTEKSIALLSARAGRAFHEMTPIRFTPAEPGRVYRKIAYGPLLDVFFLDLRSYRGPNGPDMEETLTPQSRILGEEQVRWLKRELANSKATWKVIACDMPLGLIVWDNGTEKKGAEAVSNGDSGPARGRELEIADLLRFIKNAAIDNTVWLTADVHYTAAHYYNPDKAQFQDFDAVLGIRVGAAACRHVRSQRSRPDVRPRAQIREGAERRTGPEPAAVGRVCSSSASSTSTGRASR